MTAPLRLNPWLMPFARNLLMIKTTHSIVSSGSPRWVTIAHNSLITWWCTTKVSRTCSWHCVIRGHINNMLAWWADLKFCPLSSPNRSASWSRSSTFNHGLGTVRSFTRKTLSVTMRRKSNRRSNKKQYKITSAGTAECIDTLLTQSK